jgi:AbrB family looped-hinge helix DNA binding protein
MQENDGKYIFGVVKVGEKGQIVIPRDARKVYDIKPGDALLLLGDQKGMALVKTEIFQSAVDQVMGDITKLESIG